MASTANDREKALETALAQIERAFGKGSVMRLGEDGRAPVEVIPTGSIALDLALGIGGYPRGRIVEVYGPESSGKTTVALHAIANVQAAGGLAAFIDAEHALDPDYASKLGVDLDNAPTRQATNAESDVECDRSGRDDLDGRAALLTESHDRALAELALDLGEGGVEGLLAVAAGDSSGVGDVRLGGHGLSFVHRRGPGVSWSVVE